MTTTPRQRWAHRARVVEAMALLTGVGIAQRWLAMPRWASILGQPTAVPDRWQGGRIALLPSRTANAHERLTAIEVERASKALPWTPTCLAQAAAGQVLLRQSGHAGVVVIGVRRQVGSASFGWITHAWLLGRRGALLGGPAAAGFSPSTCFEVQGGLRPEAVDLSPDVTPT